VFSLLSNLFSVKAFKTSRYALFQAGEILHIIMLYNFSHWIIIV